MNQSTYLDNFRESPPASEAEACMQDQASVVEGIQQPLLGTESLFAVKAMGDDPLLQALLQDKTNCKIASFRSRLHWKPSKLHPLWCNRFLVLTSAQKAHRYMPASDALQNKRSIHSHTHQHRQL